MKITASFPGNEKLVGCQQPVLGRETISLSPSSPTISFPNAVLPATSLTPPVLDLLQMCGIALTAECIFFVSDQHSLYPLLEATNNDDIFGAAWIGMFVGICLFCLSVLAIVGIMKSSRKLLLAVRLSALCGCLFPEPVLMYYFFLTEHSTLAFGTVDVSRETQMQEEEGRDSL